MMDELTHVELPFIEQLKAMGWEHLQGDIDVAYLGERETFREVILKDRLHAALLRVNPWLDDNGAREAASHLERLGSHRLMEANTVATDLMLSGVPIATDDSARDKTAHFIDFDNPQNNDFLAVNQFRVDIPGGQTFIVPDIVLFVNGIPLVVVECKSPKITDPMTEGINQLLRYSNQRHWVPENEGNERLFHYNQFMISTHWYKARVGTIGAQFEHYLEWKDTSPVPMAQVAKELGVEKLTSQQMLVAGMLRKEHLIDLIRNFTLFKSDAVKIVARYQQFRAVHKAIDKLTHGQTRRQHGEHDLRGGVIWHTQGSGKSLTMVFLLRKLRTLPVLRRFKVIVVTDRTDLQDQLAQTATLTGQTVQVAEDIRQLKAELKKPGPELVFAMIQKYQTRDTKQLFPQLNASEEILVLVDEAHRSQSSDLHANLMRALPNCARIGFTGTPIIMGNQTRTHEIFGEYIDRYTIRESQEDQATVEILYEGRTAEGEVADGRSLDRLFEDMFQERTEKELEAIRQRYATRGQVLEATKLIEAKAEDILRHYVDNILPGGFKAQVVAVSRIAAMKYEKAFKEAHERLIAALESDGQDEFLQRARPHLQTIKRLEFATIISGDHNDPPEYREWTDKAKQKGRIDRFKKPLCHDDPRKQDGLAFLIVKSMLLTGFDAPIEQVLYLDRGMRGHELLQAIARTNRTHTGKPYGLIVDYFGVGHHLQEALAIYTASDIEGALVSIRDELPKLDARHKRCIAVFTSRGIASIRQVDKCVDLLRDQKIRAEFIVKFRQFMESMDIVIPRPEALPYRNDAKILGFICKAAMNLYRDEQLSIAGVGPKVRQLIDEHIQSQGIDPRIPPVSIMDNDFASAVEKHVSPKAKASEMEHAARYHIRIHWNEDPSHYKKLSERLEDVLQTFGDRWEELEQALRGFVKEVRVGRKADETGLDPTTQAPFLGVILETIGEVEPERKKKLAGQTVELVEHVRQEISAVDFWRNVQAQKVLHGWIVVFLDDNSIIPYEQTEAVADQLMGLAKTKHPQLVR